MSVEIIDCLRLAGLAQAALVLGSAFIPFCLNWKKELEETRGLVRQLFWTYAGYILGAHGFFAAVSYFAPDELTAGGILPQMLCGLMAVWWSVRLALQFCYFDRSNIPATAFNKVAEALLVLLFACLSVVYTWAFYCNLG